MKWYLLLLLFVSFLSLKERTYSVSGKNNSIETDYTCYWDSLTVLKNPHKGWYHHYYDNGIWAYGIKGDGIGDDEGNREDEFSLLPFFPLLDHFYIRLAWSYLEPEEGIYDWHLIDEVIDKYVPLGYGISFRITCRETGSYPGAVGQNVEGINYATPKWVKDAGAKGRVLPENQKTAASWVPDYGDPVFLEKLERFHQVFAGRYDEQPYIRYVDIGSVGDWGEGHTSFSTSEEVDNEILKKHMDIYRKHYRYSQLVMVEGFAVYNKEPFHGATTGNEKIWDLIRYARERGITFRSDSFMVDYYMSISGETWSVTRPYLFDEMYLYKPIIYELEHYSFVKNAGNWKGKNGAEENKYGQAGKEYMEKSIALSHATYIGYHGYLQEWLADNPELTCRLANRCGYWYFPVKAVSSYEINYIRNSLLFTWINKGVAPAYQSYSLFLLFVGEDEKYEIEIKDSGNKEWLPDVYITFEYTYSIPDTVNPGMYRVYVKLWDHLTGRTIDIGVERNILLDDQYLPVGEVHLQTSPTGR